MRGTESLLTHRWRKMDSNSRRDKRRVSKRPPISKCSSISPLQRPPRRPNCSSRSASRPCRRLPGSPRHCSCLEQQCSFLGISLGSLVGGPAISHGGFAARSEDLGGNRHCRLDDQPGRHTQRSAVSGRSDRPSVSRAAETHAAATTDSTPLGTTGKVIVTVVPDARRLSMARLPP